MLNRVNKNNKPQIIKYMVNRFNQISKKNDSKLSIIDIWDVQLEVEQKFNISDYQVEKLTSELL
tara:strand:- start:6666 stop:6857 length:192 start_codon:yes stop_codon:yes gene_type:complete